MAVSARPAVLAAVLAGCTGPRLDKAGGRQSGEPAALTLANFGGDSGELDGFADNVARLSGGTKRIDIESRWRQGQAGFESVLIGDVRAGKADLRAVGSAVEPGAAIPAGSHGAWARSGRVKARACPDRRSRVSAGPV
jgi:hypothetical protein